MKKIFHSHPDVILAVLALAFLGILLAFYLWAINDIFLEVHRALTSSQPMTGEGFDLSAASRLDLRGLLNTTSSAPTQTPVPPAASTTATSTEASST